MERIKGVKYHTVCINVPTFQMLHTCLVFTNQDVAATENLQLNIRTFQMLPATTELFTYHQIMT